MLHPDYQERKQLREYLEPILKDFPLIYGILGIGINVEAHEYNAFQVNLSADMDLTQINGLLPQEYLGYQIIYDILYPIFLQLAEIFTPEVLAHPETIRWYQDHMPPREGTDLQNQYVLIGNQRYAMKDLPFADWQKLQELFPDGPEIVQ